MNHFAGPLPGLIIIEPRVFSDERGYFYESFKQQDYALLGIPNFVQDNISRSKKNTLRGLHFQIGVHAQGKLVFVTRGSVLDVVVDIRRDSPSFGQSFSITLNDENHRQMYIPPGFAHGFCVLSEEADFIYKCTTHYQPGTEGGICWNDPELNIDWPTNEPILSPKDKLHPTLAELLTEKTK